MKKKPHAVVILADSLALPRIEPEVVYLEETYPYLLQEKYGCVINCASGYSTSTDILWRLSYLKHALSDTTIIFNFGIVDCVPRVLTRYESWILRKFKITLSDLFVSFLRKIRIVRKVSPIEFETNCLKIKELISESNYCILPIVDASDGFEAMIPNVAESIDLYNSILKDVFKDRFLEIDFDLKIDVMSDHYHLTKIGHKKIYSTLSNYLRDIL